MKTKQPAYQTIDEYIAAYPENVQAHLSKIRATIRELAPDAQETISYGIPTFKQNGKYLIYFAAYKRHLSVYPAPTGVEQFAKDVARYGKGKGTLQFPLNEKIPYGLLRRLVKYRLKQNAARITPKTKKN